MTLGEEAVVVVTGASSGIGRSIAEACLERGATVYLSSDNAVRLHATWCELREKFRHVEHEVCDVRKDQEVNKLISRVLASSGRIDVLINNAGYATYQPFVETSTAEILDVLDVNLGGVMRCTRAALPSMMKRRSGRIVNIGSIGGEIIITPNAVYCGAKHGLVAWSRAMRYELSRFGIVVSVVCPGYTRTAFHDHPTFKRRTISRSAFRKGLTPRRVADSVIRAIRTGKSIVYVPWWHRHLVALSHAAPWARAIVWDRLALRRVDSLYREIAAETRDLQ